MLPVKEIAITKVRRSRIQKHLITISPRWIRSQLLGLMFILVGISGALYFGLQINNTQNFSIATSNSIPAPAVIHPLKPTVLAAVTPTKLQIARLSINADLVPVDRLPNGTIHVPTPYGQAGWYKQAPTPGELGPAIIVGHVDSQTGISVFWRLREAQPGDIVEVSRADGTTIKFKVDEIKQFSIDNFPTKEVYGNINYAGIRVVTCGGVFNRQTGHYNLNIVVFGTLVIS